MLMNVLLLPRTTVTRMQPAPTQLEVLHVLVNQGTLVMEQQAVQVCIVLNNKSVSLNVNA